MTKQQLANALEQREDQLDIISVVTGVSEDRLEEIIKSGDMTQEEFIVLSMHS